MVRIGLSIVQRYHLYKVDEVRMRHLSLVVLISGFASPPYRVSVLLSLWIPPLSAGRLSPSPWLGTLRVSEDPSGIFYWPVSRPLQCRGN